MVGGARRGLKHPAAPERVMVFNGISRIPVIIIINKLVGPRLAVHTIPMRRQRETACRKESFVHEALDMVMNPSLIVILQKKFPAKRRPPLLLSLRRGGCKSRHARMPPFACLLMRGVHIAISGVQALPEPRRYWTQGDALSASLPCTKEIKDNVSHQHCRALPSRFH